VSAFPEQVAGLRGANETPVPKLISLIVTTYNREDALDAVLRGLARQSDKAFEVIVADDGSGPATMALVESWKSRLDRPLAHVWQEDRGFRAAEIRNRAVLACQGEYCVFLDGDCIPRQDFVAAHRRLAEPGWFVTGNRVLLLPGLTAKVLRDRLEPELWGLGRWIGQRWRGGINRLPPLLRLPLGALRRLRARAWWGARSCNIGIWRGDLMRVDGFDAAFSGWGREDSDLFVRLLRAGVRRKDGVFATGVLHLWHPEADRSHLPENERKLDAAVRGDRARALRGLSEFRPVDAQNGPKNPPQFCAFADPRAGREMPGGVAP
jgi:glycosyltransferase involved in cell wall biosynthesis